MIMKIKLIVPMLFLTAILFGCAGRLLTPVYGPSMGGTNPPVIVGWIPNTNAINSAGVVGKVGGVLPTPGNWILGGLSSLFVAGLGVYARIKSTQVNKGQAILNAVISGVEAAGDADVKKTIASHVAVTGHASEFDANVQSVVSK
jgi:hypothetical protein